MFPWLCKTRNSSPTPTDFLVHCAFIPSSCSPLSNSPYSSAWKMTTRPGSKTKELLVQPKYNSCHPQRNLKPNILQTWRKNLTKLIIVTAICMKPSILNMEEKVKGNTHHNACNHTQQHNTQNHPNMINHLDYKALPNLTHSTTQYTDITHHTLNTYLLHHMSHTENMTMAHIAHHTITTQHHQQDPNHLNNHNNPNRQTDKQTEKAKEKTKESHHHMKDNYKILLNSLEYHASEQWNNSDNYKENKTLPWKSQQIITNLEINYYIENYTEEKPASGPHPMGNLHDILWFYIFE